MIQLLGGGGPIPLLRTSSYLLGDGRRNRNSLLISAFAMAIVVFILTHAIRSVYVTLLTLNPTNRLTRTYLQWCRPVAARDSLRHRPKHHIATNHTSPIRHRARQMSAISNRSRTIFSTYTPLPIRRIRLRMGKLFSQDDRHGDRSQLLDRHQSHHARRRKRPLCPSTIRN